MKIIDIHVHDGKSPWSITDMSLKEIANLAKKYDIEKCLISSIEAISYDPISGNKKMFEAIAKNDFFEGYLVINTNYPEISSNLIQEYAKSGIAIGVKIHPFCAQQPIDSDLSLQVLEELYKLKAKLLIHTHGQEPNQEPYHIENMLDVYPDMPVIIAHMGANSWLAAIRVAKKHDYVYVEPSTRFADVGKIECAVKHLGAERVLFGSDMPIIDPSFTIGMIESSKITDEDKYLILNGNAKKLFHLS